jgi:LPS-assembly lipoprotein
MWWSEALRPGRLLGAGLLVLLAVLPAACGFRVSGTPDLPPVMAVTHIQTTDRYSPFYRRLTTVLRQNGITVAGSPADARTVIRILTDETDRRLLSVSTGNVPTEYEVYYRVRFTVSVDGREVVPLEQLALSRDFSFDEFRVLGKSREEGVLREALARDLVSLVVRRLSTIRGDDASDSEG